MGYRTNRDAIADELEPAVRAWLADPNGSRGQIRDVISELDAFDAEMDRQRDAIEIRAHVVARLIERANMVPKVPKGPHCLASRCARTAGWTVDLLDGTSIDGCKTHVESRIESTAQRAVTKAWDELEPTPNGHVWYQRPPVEIALQIAEKLGTGVPENLRTVAT